MVIVEDEEDDEGDGMAQQRLKKGMEFAPFEQRQQRFIKKVSLSRSCESLYQAALDTHALPIHITQLATASVEEEAELQGGGKERGADPMRGRMKLEHAPPKVRKKRTRIVSWGPRRGAPCLSLTPHTRTQDGKGGKKAGAKGSGGVKYTPLEQQVLSLKREQPDALLMVRALHFPHRLGT